MKRRTVIESQEMTEDEIRSAMQGIWECENEPSRFRLKIEGDDLSVNDNTPEKIKLERFGRSWSFYPRIYIDGDIIRSVTLERASIETFRIEGSTIKMFLMRIFPTSTETGEDLSIYDCALFSFNKI